jgi:hypothetical protein
LLSSPNDDNPTIMKQKSNILTSNSTNGVIVNNNGAQYLTETKEYISRTLIGRTKNHIKLWFFTCLLMKKWK